MYAPLRRRKLIVAVATNVELSVSHLFIEEYTHIVRSVRRVTVAAEHKLLTKGILRAILPIHTHTKQ